MPLYEYQCKQCGHRFEKIQSFSAADEKECPVCKGELERLISAPAVQFKGSGWYATDYAAKGRGSGAGAKSDGGSGDGGSGEGSSGNKPSGGSEAANSGSSSNTPAAPANTSAAPKNSSSGSKE